METVELKPCHMTADEAIKVLERISHTESKWPGTEDSLTALDMAINALHRAESENKPLTVVLPCKIGDTIYEVEGGEITPYYVTGFVLGKTEFEDDDDVSEREGWQIEYGQYGIDCECPISEFGKSLFLTREAAEQVLTVRKLEGSEP